MPQKVLPEDNYRTTLGVCHKNVPSDKYPQYLAVSIATLSAFSMGTCLSWTSAALPMLTPAGAKIPITAEEGSWIGALLMLGAFAGAIPAGKVISRVGPKRTLQIVAFPLFASWIVIAYCRTVFGLYIARSLAGIAIGTISVAAPTYIAELAEVKIRGALGTLFQLQITCGLLFGYVIGGSVEDFTMLALISGVVPVVYLISLSFVPESPVHLTSKGDVWQARISLQWFRGKEYDVEDEMMRIKDNARDNDGVKLSEMIKCKAVRKALLISLGLMVFQQLSGINAVLFYTANIFEDNGNVCAMVIGAIQVVATYVSTLFIDRAGRRVLLLISSSVMFLCLFLLASYYYIKEFTHVSLISYLPILSLGSFIVFFSIGFGPIPWLMMGELFDSKVKSVAVSISVAFNWLLAFCVTKSFHNLVDVIGSSFTFGIFGIVCLIGTIFVYFVVPETKGKTVDEIMISLGRMDKSKDIRTDESNII